MWNSYIIAETQIYKKTHTKPMNKYILHINLGYNNTILKHNKILLIKKGFFIKLFVMNTEVFLSN